MQKLRSYNAGHTKVELPFFLYTCIKQIMNVLIRAMVKNIFIR